MTTRSPGKRQGPQGFWRFRLQTTEHACARPQRATGRSVHCGRTRSLAGAVCAEQKGSQHEPDRHVRELHVDVLVALHLRLLIQLVVDRSQGEAAAVGASEVAAEKARKS